MKHMLLTRSAYPPSYPLAANRRRLELLRHVTVPSLKAQTERRWTWIVLMDPADPLNAKRKAVLEGAGVPLAIVERGQMTHMPAASTPDGDRKSVV